MIYQTSVAVTSQSYSIVVGAGGVAPPAVNDTTRGTSGGNSSGLGYTANGGGAGGSTHNSNPIYTE